ncbi:chromate transporter [uncultured Tissierella sp.]|uniref:chromate transporter n=2 Tax=Tissierella TaxID=41273 RepID=UPI0028052766|nr:chromate transporter [uncultured Tissierella sp.]MDU5081695.1 chromate transporter [Bacillota bacterium]
MRDINYKDLNRTDKIERQKEIVKVFLKLGSLAFGGPAAHIAMMEEEIIDKRKWITREKFMDLIGATNLIPGPNSTELAIHLGYERGGLLGLLLAGTFFIFPAMVIVLLFAITYVKYGSIPQVGSILYGMKPVIMAIILQALYRLGKSVIKNKISLVLGLFTIAVYLLGIKEIPLLFISGIIMMIMQNKEKLKNRMFGIGILPLYLVFFIFLKIGSVLYGSGYVLLAFLEAEFVEKLGLLTNQQLLDAVAVGQFTPGPVFTTATFTGYLLRGIPGAILGTIGIFLPSFILVWALNPLIPKLRSSSWISGMLDGINIASLALMATVSFKLGISSLTDGLAIIIFIVSLFSLIKFKINSAWIIVAGGLVGWISSLI